MRRALTALIVTVVVVVLIVNFQVHQPALNTTVLSAAKSGAAAGATPSVSAAPASGSTTTKTSASTTTQPSATPKVTSSKSATGSAIQYQYGVIQVRATVRGSRLTKVRVVQLNPRDGRSQGIDAQAVPALQQEALQAHSANIDVVSGATYTSQAYAQSLQSAIDQARGA